MTKTILLAAAAAATLVTGTIAAAPSLFAQGTPAPAPAPERPGAQDPRRITAGTYALDPVHTLVGWEVNHFGFNDYLGTFGNITGTMTLDPNNIEAATLSITIPINEVTVASAGLKEHLLRPSKDGAAPDFFGPTPTATFTSTRIRRTGPTTATITGTLTINGKGSTVTLETLFVGAGVNPFTKKETVGFHARTFIDRTRWDINYGVPLIGRDVGLFVSAAFEKQ